MASFVAGLTLASGLLFLVLAVLRMGWLAQFLSRAVVTGFLFGAAIDVVIGELPKITGTDVSGVELVPAAPLLVRVAGRRASRDLGARCRLAGRGVRAAGRRAAGPRRTRPGRRRAPRVIPVRPRGSRRLPGRRCASRTAVVRHSGHRADVGPRGHGGGRRRRVDVDRLLADGRRRARLRGKAPVPDRRRPGVRCAGRREHGLGVLPRDAGLDEPFRKLAQRPRRCSYRPCVASPPASLSC